MKDTNFAGRIQVQVPEDVPGRIRALTPLTGETVAAFARTAVLEKLRRVEAESARPLSGQNAGRANGGEVHPEHTTVIDFEDLARQHPVLSSALAGGRFPFDVVPVPRPTEVMGALSDPRFAQRVSGIGADPGHRRAVRP